MFWNVKTLKFELLPEAPKGIDLSNHGAQLIYAGWFWKKHPHFNKWSERILVLTDQAIMWAQDIEDDNRLETDKVFRRSSVVAIKPAAGPQMLPGVGIQIGDRTFIFSHDDPREIDYFFNLLAVWVGLRQVSGSLMEVEDPQQQCWPEPHLYVGMLPVVRIGVAAPGEAPPYPNPAFGSDPLFTPSQVAFFGGSRVLSMGLLNVRKQTLRFLMTNEGWICFDSEGDIQYKFFPNEIHGLRTIQGEEMAINHLGLSNIDIEMETIDNDLTLRSHDESRCQWNAALGSFMGVIPAFDCIANVQPFTEDGVEYESMFVRVKRTSIKRHVKILREGRKAVMNSSDESDSGYFQEPEEDGDPVAQILIEQIIQEDAEETLEEDAASPRHMHKQQRKFARVVQQATAKLEQYMEEADETESEEESYDVTTDKRLVVINELQEKQVKYALSKLTKVLDDVQDQRDASLNTWEILLPPYDSTETDSDTALLVDEAAQHRRRILRAYIFKFYINKNKELKTASPPEPFGDAADFIQMLEYLVPLTLQPGDIGVPFPAGDFLSIQGKQARQELTVHYQAALTQYGEMLALLKAFLAEEQLYQEAHPSMSLFDPTHKIESLDLRALCPSFFEYELYKPQQTALDVYKIAKWYAFNTGKKLAIELRKSIAAETLLQMEQNSAAVLNATEEMLVMGRAVTEQEAKRIVGEIAQLTEQEENEYCKSLDADISSHFGHNLHIFGANERVRRAASLLLIMLLSRLEAKVIKQFSYYFVSLGGQCDICTDFQEAIKYITRVPGQNYMQVFTQQHAWHLTGLGMELIDVYALKHCKLAEKLALQKRIEEYRFTGFLGETWVSKGSFLKFEDKIYVQRGFVVEKVAGARPDAALPVTSWLHWLCDKLYILSLQDGPKLNVHAVFCFKKTDTGFVITQETRSPDSKKLCIEAIINEAPKTWTMRCTYGDQLLRFESIPGSLTPLLMLFALAKDLPQEPAVNIPVGPLLYRLLIYQAPLDQQEVELRLKEDRDERIGLVYCDMGTRKIVLKEDEIEHAHKMFQE